MAIRFTWHYDRERNRYVVMRGACVYQEIPGPVRDRNRAHTRTYVERCVRMLNGED